jgi:hypothetical protein
VIRRIAVAGEGRGTIEDSAPGSGELMGGGIHG